MKFQSVVVSLKIDRNMAEAQRALRGLRGDDLSELCRMFELSAGGSRDERIARLLKMGDKAYSRLVRLSREVTFGYHAENHVSFKKMREIVLSLGLSASGNKHEMFMNAVTNDKSLVQSTLAAMDIKGIRKIYKRLLGKPPIDSEVALKNEILQWLNFEPYHDPPVPAQPKTYPGTSLPPLILQQAVKSTSTPSTQVISSDSSQQELANYDVAISYAGEDVGVANDIAEALKGVGVRVFFAPFEQANLWGKKLSDFFGQTYGPRATYVLVLISKHYPQKDFTNFEFTIARDEARKRKEEFILPVRLDSTPIIGLHPDVHYLDYEEHGAKGVASLVKEKLSDRARRATSRFGSLINALTKSGQK